MRQHIVAFMKGVREFRQSFTANYEACGAQASYDLGRELAHRFTLRYYEQF